MRKENNRWSYVWKKTGILVLSILLAGSLMTGCGSSKKEETEKTSENSDPDGETSEKEDTSEAEDGSEETLGIPDAESYLEKLADYKNITIKKSEIEEKLQESIDSLLANDSYKSGEQIKSGKVKDGDTVNIYYVGKIDGKAFDGGSCTKETNPEGYDLTIGSGTFIPGFEDSLIGKEIGKTVDINVTFPEDYGNEDLNGKDAVFTVTLNYKLGTKKEFNDAFVAKNLSDSYSSVKDYKKQKKEEIFQNLVLQKVLDGTEVKEYPKDLLEETEKQFVTPIEKYNSSQGLTMEQFISQNYESEEAYKEDLDKNVKAQLKGQLVYNTIATREGIEIKEDEIEESIKTYIESYGAKDEDALNEQFLENYGGSARKLIFNNLLYQHVLEYIKEHAKQK